MDIDFLKIFTSIWQVLLVGLIFGAGLPALFALGMRSLSSQPLVADGVTVVRPTTLGRVGAAFCFGLTGLIALFGVVVIIFGKQMFGH